MIRISTVIQVVGGIAIAILLPVLVIALAAPLSTVCNGTWILFGYALPNYCTSTPLPPLFYGLVLLTIAPGLVAVARKTFPFGVSEITVGLIAWLFLSQIVIATPFL
jgi:hypothetical protein